MSEKYRIFEKYVAEHKRALSRLCCTLCGNYADAEDLFQETWYKAIKNYDKFDKSRSFEKWLFTICINTYKDNCTRFSFKKNIQFNTNDEKDIFLSSIADEQIRNEN